MIEIFGKSELFWFGVGIIIVGIALGFLQFKLLSKLRGALRKEAQKKKKSEAQVLKTNLTAIFLIGLSGLKTFIGIALTYMIPPIFIAYGVVLMVFTMTGNCIYDFTF